MKKMAPAMMRRSGVELDFFDETDSIAGFGAV